MQINLPELGENIESATVLRILVKVGDTISRDQTIMELETEKAAVDLPASASGTVKEISVKQGDTIKVGQAVMLIVEAGAAEKPAPPTPLPAPPPVPLPPQERLQDKPKETVVSLRSARSPASPALRRMARKLGIDVHDVDGTGMEGRITEEDIENHARSLIQAPRITSAASPQALPDFSRWGDVERKAMSGIRRKTAERLQQAWSSIPHVTQFDFADVTALEAIRQEASRKVEKAGGKLTITAIMIKVVASALKVFPQFNVSIDMASGEIISKKYFHIGVAVDTEHGLLVPVIRNVDRKNILELSVELPQMAEQARNRKLAVDDMQGGSFTITNLGGIGGSHFTPIINLPEVAILGISRTVQEGAKLVMPLSLSYDHRAVDGADGARFIRWIAEALENPFLLSLEG